MCVYVCVCTGTGGGGGGGGAGDVEELSETMSQASLDSKASGNPAPRKGKPYGGGAFGAGMGLERQEVRGCNLLLLFMLSKRNVYAFIQALGEDETTETGDKSRPRGISQLEQVRHKQEQWKSIGCSMDPNGAWSDKFNVREVRKVKKHTERLNKFVAEANGGGGGGGGGGSSGGGTGAPAPAPAGE